MLLKYHLSAIFALNCSFMIGYTNMNIWIPTKTIISIARHKHTRIHMPNIKLLSLGLRRSHKGLAMNPMTANTSSTTMGHNITRMITIFPQRIDNMQCMRFRTITSPRSRYDPWIRRVGEPPHALRLQSPGIAGVRAIEQDKTTSSGFLKFDC